jgi:phenylacetate-CoA ligase
MSSGYLDRWVSEDLIREAQNEASLCREAAGRRQLTRALIERLQFVKLCRTLRYVAEKSPFYKKLYAEHGFDPSSVRSLADLQRVPFVEPTHVVRESYGLVCVPIGDVARIVTLASSGTSGEKKRVLFTESDLQRMVALLAVDAKVVVGEKKAIVQVMLPGQTPLGQAHLLGKGLETAGAIAVVTGNSPDVTSQIESISRNRCTALVGYPSYLHRLTRLGRLRYDLAQMGIEAIVTAGEPLPSSMKSVLERTWRAKVFSHYGLTEMGFNAGMGCGCGIGYHIHEADYIVEVLDSASGQTAGEGEEGELVITSIHREGMPIVRYKTGDMTRIISEPCACGSILKRIGSVKRRAETTITVGQEEIDMRNLDERLFSVPEIVDYRVAVRTERRGPILQFLVQTTGEATLTPGVIRNIVEEELSAKGADCKSGVAIEIEFTSSLEPVKKRSAAFC